MAVRVQITHNNIMNVAAEIRPAADDMAKNVAQGIEGYANTFVPVLTGALKLSIKATNLGGASWEVTAQSTEGGADRDYAGYVEFGTSKMAAQPYMLPAYATAMATTVPVESRKFVQRIERAA